MNTNKIKKITSFCLAFLTAATTLSTASCGKDGKSAAYNPPPEMEYPKLYQRHYNSDGELVSEDLYEYDADGHLFGRKYSIYKMDEMGLSGMATETSREAVGKYEYENGRLTRFTFHETYSDSGYEEESVYSYVYDKNGLVKEIEKNENGKYTGKTSYMRDGSGNVKRMVYYNESGGFNGMIEHKYDASGRCVEEKEYDTQSIISRHVYQYDQSGNVTECMVYNKYSLACHYRFEYGSDGALLRESWLDGNGNVYRAEEYSFDEKGRRKSRTDTEDRTIDQIIIYEAYDDNDNCIKLSMYNGKHILLDRYEYEYGSEKVQKIDWELESRRFHGDFLL